MGEKGLREGVLEYGEFQRLKALKPGWERDLSDPHRAFNPTTGQNGHWDSDKGQWTDSKTGEALTPPVYK